MSEMMADCPRCGCSKTTFDVYSDILVGSEFGWQTHHEAFAVCRACLRSTVFRLKLKGSNMGDFSKLGSIAALKLNANHYLQVSGFISIAHISAVAPPEFLPDAISARFEEGARCMAVSCWNAAAAMFRLCLDLATKNLLPPPDAGGPTKAQRDALAPRLEWLFANNKLPLDLKGMAACIRQDGNDGVHDGALTENDALDLCDFAHLLLERVYTDPRRVELADGRRAERRRTSQKLAAARRPD